ncbi:autoinducer 2 ABC transporter substrate-binding protein [Tepidanaerobacter acetatoxydans]|uniref:autoinducer 2 ABC transporter substrate-binding protein n=1 Tax=Tepidanaerobacter acetatoxydans TaxID=499229 RepID=UPI001BD42289|nr:autoinducer 2 ABC transporter substrate-binding protein [Tepidanaerobacter acetatoxydans]
MKKLAMFLVLLLTFSMLTGCGGTSTTPSNNEKNENEAKKYVIANVPKMVGIAWWDRMEVGNKQFAKETGHEVFQVGASKADAAEQVKVIEDVIAQGVDAINVIPVSPEALEPVLKKAMDNGVVVISHEAPNQENVNYDIEAFRNKEYGAHIMENLATEMGGKGGYCIMVGALTMASHQEWAAGAIEYQKAKYPDMYQVCDMVESMAQGGSQEGSYKVAKEVIASYPEIKGFIGMDMTNAPGIAMAIEEAGKAGEIALTGTSLVSVVRDYLENGTINKISFWDPAIAGRAMCSLAVKVIEGEEIKNGIDLGVPGFEECTLEGNLLVGSAWVDVTKENMADYDF